MKGNEKMKKIKDNSCIYCAKSDKNENLIGIKYLTESESGTIDIYVGEDIDGEAISLVYEHNYKNDIEDDFTIHSHPINFCPICGKSLKRRCVYEQ